MPDSTEDLAEVVRLCGAEGIALIPYGGGTGVVAGQLLDGSDRGPALDAPPEAAAAISASPEQVAVPAMVAPRANAVLAS